MNGKNSPNIKRVGFFTKLKPEIVTKIKMLSIQHKLTYQELLELATTCLWEKTFGQDDIAVKILDSSQLF